MPLIPEISFGLYNTWLLSVSYLAISIGLMFLIPKHNISKFVKVPKIKYVNEANYVLYYGFIVLSIFIPLHMGTLMFYIGIAFFVVGILLYFVSIFYFAISEYDKPVTEKIYQISRHPVYLSFFLIGIGISLAGASWVLIIVLTLHFATTIRIIKEEEKSCTKIYGKEYEEYKKKVRMII